MAQAPKEAKKSGPDKGEPTDRPPACGIIRPISPVDGYPLTQWQDVHDIIADAIRSAGFEPQLVSEDETGGVILSRIVGNLYDNPIAICDVSTRNPNVMFELGMRLAFDMPVVIIKDERTAYPFDVSVLEYLEYPSDLRHPSVEAFRAKVTRAIRATADAPTQEGYRSFLKHFGARFDRATLGEARTSIDAVLLDEMQSMKAMLSRIINPTLSSSGIGMFGRGKSRRTGEFAGVGLLSTAEEVAHSTVLRGEQLLALARALQIHPAIVGVATYSGERDSMVNVSYLPGLAGVADIVEFVSKEEARIKATFGAGS